MTHSRREIEAIVDAAGEGLGVDTACCSTSRFEIACELVEALLEKGNKQPTEQPTKITDEDFQHWLRHHFLDGGKMGMRDFVLALFHAYKREQAGAS